jgi:hypothetical protein
VTLAKVSPGQPLRIPADTFNAFVDAAVAYQATRTSRQADGGANLPTAGVIIVRNDSGADQDRFAVLGIGTPLILPTENAAAFQERVAMALVAPDADAHVDRICILQEPIAAGKLGRGLILGITPVRLNVQAEDDRVAAVVTGETSSLKTGSTGAARILWKEAGTGEVWGIVQIPSGGAGGGSPNLVLEVTSANHPWMVGDVLRWNGTGWILADAGVVGDTDTLAVVGRIPDANTALLVLWGVFCLEGLTDHTDYWLDPGVPGMLTPTKPTENPRLVLHHAEAGLCVLRAGAAGGGGSASRFADLTDVDVATTPPTDAQAALWDATAERWKPLDVVVADPVPAHLVLAGPTSGADARPDFRDLAVGDLAEQAGTSVVANATGGSARPIVFAADTDGTALLRLGGVLRWAQIPTAAIEDHAVTSDKLADGSVSEPKLQRDAVSTLTIRDGAVVDAKITSLSWGKITGKPATYPPSDHEHPLQGDIGGWTDATIIQPGAVTAGTLAPGAVTTPALADSAIVTAKVANGAITDAKIISVAWAKITGKPQDNLGGDLTGSLDNAQLAPGVVSTAEIADGAVTNAKLQKDFLRIGTTDWHLGETVTGIMTNPMTGVGDLITGGSAGAPTRIPANQGGTLQILTSKNSITALVPHTMDQMEDVTIVTPADGHVLAFEAASNQWKNKAPANAGHGQHPAMVGKITSKSSGNTYAITLYPEYPSLAVAWVISCTQLQGDTTKTIPANTWTIACGVLKAGQAGTAAAHYDFFIQVPVWM